MIKTNDVEMPKLLNFSVFGNASESAKGDSEAFGFLLTVASTVTLSSLYRVGAAQDSE
jgi:hypothetical protein